MVIPNNLNWKTEMVKLGAGIYSYVQAGGAVGVSNAGLIVGGKNNIVIDTLAINQSETWKQEISKITANPAQYIVNTHAHPDHFGGNHLYPEAIHLCHHNCYSDLKRMYLLNQQGEKALFPGADIALSLTKLPDLTFNDSLTIYSDMRKIEILHFGFAHTRGDVIVSLPDENIVFCGDLLFLYSTPVIRGGYIGSWIEALNKIIALDAKIYIPGHGPPCDKNGLLKCLNYLKLIYNEAKKAYNAKISFRDAALNIKLGDFKLWTHPERVLINVYRVYQDLKGEDLSVPEDPRLLFEEMRELARSGW